MTTSTVDELQAPPKAIHISAWVVQGLLAAAFAMAGLFKLTTSSAELAAQGAAWINDAPAFLPKFIGVVELLGAVGLILPSALRIKPILTPLAAAGLFVVMALAAFVNISVGESPMPNFILGGLAAFVVWARFKKSPISPR